VEELEPTFCATSEWWEVVPIFVVAIGVIVWALRKTVLLANKPKFG